MDRAHIQERPTGRETNERDINLERTEKVISVVNSQKAKSRSVAWLGSWAHTPRTSHPTPQILALATVVSWMSFN